MLPNLAALGPRAPAPAPAAPVEAHLPPELARAIARDTQNSHGVLIVKLYWEEPNLTGLYDARMSISLQMDNYERFFLPDWVAPASAAGVAAMCAAANQYLGANAGVRGCRAGLGNCGVVKMMQGSENGWASGVAAEQPLRGSICNFTLAQKNQFRALCEALAVAEEDRNRAFGQGMPYSGPPVAQARAAVLDHVRPLLRGPFEVFARDFLAAAGTPVTGLEPHENVAVKMPRFQGENPPPGRYLAQGVVTYKFPFMFPAPPGSLAYNRLMHQLTSLEFYNAATDGRRDQWERAQLGADEESRASGWSGKRARGR